MIVNLYTNSSPENAVNKSLEELAALDGSIRAPCDIMNPSLTVHSSSAIICNYVYIPVFGRYYFVTGCNIERDGVYTLSLKCDALSSFWSSCAGSACIVERSESDGLADFYLNDGEFLTDDYTILETLKADGKQFNCEHPVYILLLAGSPDE